MSTHRKLILAGCALVITIVIAVPLIGSATAKASSPCAQARAEREDEYVTGTVTDEIVDDTNPYHDASTTFIDWLDEHSDMAFPDSIVEDIGTVRDSRDGHDDTTARASYEVWPEARQAAERIDHWIATCEASA